MPKAGAEKRAILERMEQEHVRFLRLQFTDILGVIKNVEVPDRQFSEALDGGIMFDGSSIRGYKRIEQSDMYFKPDINTFAVLPWLGRPTGNVARIPELLHVAVARILQRLGRKERPDRGTIGGVWQVGGKDVSALMRSPALGLSDRVNLNHQA